MVPARQRLEADDLAAGEPDDRLVGHLDVPVGDGAPQVAAERDPIDGAVLHAGLEQLDAALTGRLGGVHGEVGVAEQLVVGDRRLVAGGDPDARSGEDLMALDLDGMVERVEHPFCDLHDRSHVGGVFEEDGELVAAEPSGGVAGAEAGTQPIGHDPEQLVARRVPEAVVHELEVVEVDERHGRGRRVLPSHAIEGVLDTVGEQRSVREAGERIVEGLVPQLVLQDAAPDASRIVSTAPATSGLSSRLTPTISAWIGESSARSSWASTVRTESGALCTS